MENKKLYMNIFIIIFTIFLSADISQKSQNLEKLRVLIKEYRLENDINLYLKEFPKSFKEFKFIFYGKPDVFDELYDKSYEHLTLLNNLANKYEKEVINIWLSIAKDAKEDADAIAYLQRQITIYYAEHIEVMSKFLLETKMSERIRIINFLADIENFYGYEPYEKILEGLKNSKKYSILYNLFYTAKIERMKRRHH